MHERKESVTSRNKLIQTDLPFKSLKKKVKIPSRSYNINLWEYLSNKDTSDYPKSTNELRKVRFWKTIYIVSWRITWFSLYFSWLFAVKRIYTVFVSLTFVKKHICTIVTAEMCHGITRLDCPKPVPTPAPPLLQALL